MKTTVLIAALIGISSYIMGQSGEIRGKIFDYTGEPLYGASIIIVDGPVATGATSNFEGEFIIKPLNAGLYSVEVTFLGYSPTKVVGINVYNNKITFLEDIHMTQSAMMGDEVVITAPRYDQISKDEPQKILINNEMIIKMPGAKNPAMLARNFQSDILVENNQMIVRGSRPGSSTVFIDGVKMRNETSTVPSMMIGSMEIYTGGIPAKYGDVTGGVIIINTKSYFDLLNERRAREN